MSPRLFRFGEEFAQAEEAAKAKGPEIVRREASVRLAGQPQPA